MSDLFPPADGLPWLRENTILFVRSGSHAYGTNTPTSDVDVKGIAVQPREYMFSFAYNFEQHVFKEPADGTVYELQKFFMLADKFNPNLIEILGVDEEDVLICDESGRDLRDNMRLFLSRRAQRSYSGFCAEQVRKIKTHRSWLLYPREQKPTRAQFGLPDKTVIDADQIGAAETLVRKRAEEDAETIVRAQLTAAWEMQQEEITGRLRDQHATFDEDLVKSRIDKKVSNAIMSPDGWAAAAAKVGFSENMIDLLQREKFYRAALKEFKQYQEWKVNRNPARAAGEAKFGYDVKFAYHIVRLQTMCREVLTEGKVIVRRPDAELLLQIRNGAWTYDQLIEWSTRQDAELEVIAETSPLPKHPDLKKLHQLCVRITERALTKGTERG